MTAYIIRRLVIGVIILIIVTMLVFLFVRLLPGDPLMIYMSSSDIQRAQTISQQEYQALRVKYGLNKPLVVQYVDWVDQLLHGNLGESINLQQPVNQLIAQRMPRTAYLGFISFVIGTLGGLIVGIICALRRGGWLDNVLTALSNIGMTIPTFYLGILLIYLFSYKLGWLPTSGWTSPLVNFGMNIKQMIMPVTCLSVGAIGGMGRFTRSCMLEVTQQDYVRTAWAKGLREKTIVLRHQIKNAFIPIITVLGGSLGVILGGSIIIENVFAIPGMGRLLTNAMFQQDYQIVQAGVLIFGAIVIFSNLLVDIAYGWLDPRIRYA